MIETEPLPTPDCLGLRVLAAGTRTSEGTARLAGGGERGRGLHRAQLDYRPGALARALKTRPADSAPARAAPARILAPDGAAWRGRVGAVPVRGVRSIAQGSGVAVAVLNALCLEAGLEIGLAVLTIRALRPQQMEAFDERVADRLRRPLVDLEGEV